MEKEYGQAPPPGYGDHGFGSQAYPPQPQAHQGYPSQPYPSQPYPSQPYPSQPYPPSSEAYPMHPQGAHHGTHLQPGPTHGMVTSGSVSSVDPPPYSPPPKFDEMVIQDQGPTPRYNDLWATILFLVNLGGFAVLAFFSFRGNPAPDPFLTPADQEALVFTLLAASAFSVGFGALYSLGLWYNARTMIFVSQFIVIALFLAYGAFCFIYVSMVAGIIWLLFALIQGIFFYFFRHRIPFAALMLKTVIGILTRYPTCLLAAFAGMGIQIAWTVLFIYVLSNAAGIWTGGSLYGICFYLVFTYYWFSQVIKNTVHVTLSGMFATHYFMLGTASFPPHPVGSSFRRAITYCFGSICFGSLIVAAIKTLRYAVRMAFRDHGILRFCADLLLGMIDNLVQYFNHYAFTEVAIYGKSFCKAGKSIWELFKRNGIDAIVNDDLIGSVLLLAVLIAAAGSFGIGFGLAYVFPQDLNPVYMGLVALLVGAMIMVVVTDAVESGTASILVCLAEDPNALLRTNPDLYQSIQDTYQTVLPSGRV